MSQATERLETYDDANTDYTKLKEAMTAYPDITGILGAPMPTSAGAGRLIAEGGLSGRSSSQARSLVSVAGRYIKNDNIQYIPVPGIRRCRLCHEHVGCRGSRERRTSRSEPTEWYCPVHESLLVPDASKKPHLLYGAG